MSVIDTQQEEGRACMLTAECVGFSIPDGAPAGDYRPYLLVKWGHGASSVAAEIDVTRRQRFPIAASSVSAEAFIKVFPFPGQSTAPAVPDGAQAQIRAFVSEGVDGIRLFPTRWVTQLSQASGVIATGQQRLASLHAFQGGAGLVYLLLFDKAALPAGGDVPFDGMPLPAPAAAVPGLVDLPMGETRGFVNGIAWGISSTPFVYTAAATDAFVCAELAS